MYWWCKYWKRSCVHLSVLVLVLVCISACIGLYLIVLGLYWWMYWRPYWHLLKQTACVRSVFAHIIISYIPNTNLILANTCWYVLVCIVIHANTFTMYLACIVACIQSVFASIVILYIHKTKTIHANRDWYVLNTDNVTCSYWIHAGMNSIHTTNTYHNTYHNTCQDIVKILACIATQCWHVLSRNTCQYLHVAITNVLFLWLTWIFSSLFFFLLSVFGLRYLFNKLFAVSSARRPSLFTWVLK